MNKFFVVIFSCFEFFFYTLVMVLIGSINITNVGLKVLVHFVSLSVISVVLYFIISFLLTKLNLKVKRFLYLIPIWNLVLGLAFPFLVLAIIPSEALATLAVVLMISTAYYGLFVNIALCILNLFLTK